MACCPAWGAGLGWLVGLGDFVPSMCCRAASQSCTSAKVFARHLAAIVAGLGLGSAVPELAPAFETVLWPALGFMLYATFTQVPLAHLPEAFRDRRFMGAVLVGNFVAVPLLVWGLLAWLPDDPTIRLGVALVLLVPCTDWFITFTHLGRGDTRRAIAVTPVNLLVQIALLPVYLWLFMGETFVEILAADKIAAVFVIIIVLPLLAAYVTERWAEGRANGTAMVERLAWLPVPLLALVVFLIAASQVEAVLGSLAVISHVLVVFVAYLVLAAIVGIVLGRLFGLNPSATRALIFSLGTRNSFVVLPLALALPAAWQAATVVIVFQSLVELFGMVAYLWAVPRLVKLAAPPEDVTALTGALQGRSSPSAARSCIAPCQARRRNG
jgi:arsenite transporter